MADHYAVAGTTWQGDLLTWAATSGGLGTLNDPTSSDNVFFDANSGSGTFTLGGTGNCLSLNFTGFTGTFTDINNQLALNVYGSLTFASGMTLSGIIEFAMRGTSSFTITSAGKSFRGNLTINGSGGTFTLQDALSVTDPLAVGTGSLTLTLGTLDLNGQSVSAVKFTSSNSNVRVLTFGSSTISLTGTGTIWSCATVTNFTLNANTGTIKSTNTSNSAVTFAGGGLTYNNLWFARAASTGSITITGANTFNDLQDTGTGIHTVVFPNSTTTIITLTDFTGSAGNLIPLTRTGGSGGWTISKATGIISIDYVNISNSTATGGASFYAGANSTDGGGNTGWIFTAPPSTAVKTINSLARASVKSFNGLVSANIKTINGLT